MHKLISLAKTKTSLNILINTVGTYIGVFTTVIYFLALARYFSKPEMAIYSVLFAIANVLANFFDLGVNASIYASVPHFVHNRAQTMEFVKSNLIFQTGIAFVALSILWLFIPIINTNLLNLNTTYDNYFWTFVSVFFFMWQNTILNTLFAREQFLYANIAQTIANVSKIALVLLLMYFNLLTVTNTIIVLGVFGQVLFIICILIKQRSLVTDFIRAPINRADIKLRYMGTYFIATQAFTLASRLDLFMIAHYLPLERVGEYSIAQKIILNIITTVNSITQVVSPQFAKVKSRQDITQLLKHSLTYILLPAGVFAAAVITPDFVYTLVLSEKWTHAIGITRALSGIYIFYTILNIPLLFFLYTIRKPVYILVINLIFLSIMAVGNYLLIPIFGVYGPAIAMGIAMGIVGAYTIFSVKREYASLT